MNDTAKLRATLKTLQAIKDRKTYRAMDFFTPYPKQQEFIDLGIAKRERLLMAANQVGKSHIGAFEMACHLTGLYPDWWLGRTFTKAPRMWAAGETSMLVRDVQQKKLCGEPGVEAAFGTGMIPRELFADRPSLARGVTDAYDTIQVKHVSGGISVLRFKSYEQGRKKMQGETLEGVWCDEEPPEDIYSEVLTRTAATNGIVWITFTPLLGKSNVVLRFIEQKSPDRGIVNMTDEDAGHITPEMRARNRAGYLPHELKARAMGVPLLGSGAVFTSSEEAITSVALEHIPAHWVKLWGLDFGIGHPFAAVLIIWDRDNDIIYIHAAFRVADALPIQHAHQIRVVGADVPVAWPHDGHQRAKGDGEPLAQMYKKYDLRMLPDHATHEKGGYSVEAGILEMDDRMKSGRLKVAPHLAEWFEEYRGYHRKEGQIVKFRDDLMDATRTAIMMKRFAKAVAVGGISTRRKQQNTVAADVEFDLF